jgi:hypothetical protein
MLQILFVGLILFAERVGGGRDVVLPSLADGVTVTTPCTPTHVEAHMAYVSAAASDVKSCTGCEDVGNRKRLRLDGDKLEITGIPTTGFTPHESFAAIIPSLQKACPAFELVIPDNATRLTVNSGTLFGQKINDERTSFLRVNTEGDVTITATRNGVVRTMVLNAGTTNVTIGNQGLSAIGGTPALAENHFLAFYKLSKNEVSCSLPIDGPGQQTTIACSNSRYP